MLRWNSRHARRALSSISLRGSSLPSSSCSCLTGVPSEYGQQWRLMATIPEEAEVPQCLLCDEEYTDWGEHARSRYHRARHAVCSALVNPEKHDAILQQIWEHIRLDFNVVDDVNAKKVKRRRNRLTSTLNFLRDSDVLRHSCYQSSSDDAVPSDGEGTEDAGSLCHRLAVSEQFTRLVAVGEPHYRFEVTDRVARLFPKASVTDLSGISQMVLHLDNGEALYDFLNLDALLTEETRASLDEEKWTHNASTKAAMIFGMVGELFEFVSRDRPHSVGTKEMADRLVLNVLATHALENLVSEIVHYVLQKIVDEGTPVWNEYKALLPKLVMGSTRLKRTAMQLSKTPTPKTSSTSSSGTAAQAQLAQLGTLHPEKLEEVGRTDTPVLIKPEMHDMIRSCAMTVTVPNPVSKTAFFSPLAPKLSLKPRTPVPKPRGA